MTTGEIYSITLAVLAAGAAGLVGAFALMKSVVLAGDVISHIALPGLGLAFLYGINPLLGGAITLGLGVILIWRIEKQTGLSTETAIGVIFASALALGTLITPREDLIDALFGNFQSVSGNAFAVGVTLSVLVMILLYKLRSRLIISLFSSDLASAMGINVDRLNLYYLLIFALTIILGLRMLGALLVGSLIIIPAAAARQLTHTLGAFLVTSVVISVVSVIVGFFVASSYGANLGPIVVLVSGIIFALSLLKKKE